MELSLASQVSQEGEGGSRHGGGVQVFCDFEEKHCSLMSPKLYPFVIDRVSSPASGPASESVSGLLSLEIV